MLFKLKLVGSAALVALTLAWSVVGKGCDPTGGTDPCAPTACTVPAVSPTP